MFMETQVSNKTWTSQYSDCPYDTKHGGFFRIDTEIVQPIHFRYGIALFGANIH